MKQGVRYLVIRLVVILLAIFCIFPASSWGEIKLNAAYPTLGLMNQNLDVTLKGTDFDQNTRVSMFADSGNERAIVGYVDTPATIYDVVVSGSYAYTAAGFGLHVIDISDSASPFVVDTVETQGVSLRLALSGNYAFVADSTEGLQVIDISTPTDPSIVGSLPLDTNQEARAITISGNKAYICYANNTENEYGFKIADISTPTTPNIIGSLIISSYSHCHEIAIQDNHAYVGCGDGLKVVDISIPSNPQIVGSVSTVGSAFGVVVSGSHAYIAASWSGLQVVDISIPSNPQIIGSVDTPDDANRVIVFGDIAYVVDRFSGIQIIDISTPSDPRIIGGIDTPEYALSAALSGNYIYMADIFNGLQIADISIISPPQIAGSVGDFGWANDLVVSGSYAYVAGPNELRVIDIGTASSPQIVGTESVAPNVAFSVDVSGNYAYVANDSDGLKVIDISTPSAPETVGAFDFDGRAFDIDVSGGYAYIADLDDTLQVINISSPTNPTAAGSLSLPHNAWNVAVSGSYAYVACDQSGLQIIDVSNPYSPYIAGTYDTLPQAIGIAVSWPYVYMGVLGEGLYVINVASPGSPYLVATIGGFSFQVTDIVVSGDRAFVAHRYTGMSVVDISDPYNPQILGTMDTLSYADGIAVSGNYAYIADGSTGLVIMPLPQEIFPVTVSSSTEITVSLPSPPIPGHYSLKVFDNSQSHVMPGAVSFTDDASILNAKAIIVAGGGPNASGGTIWEETKVCANKAYDALILQGYEHDSIYYISMETLNDYVDSTSPETFLSDLSSAINIWAADASHLLLYFADHGKEDQFVLYADGDSSQTLSAQELDGWLDTLQGTMTGPVTFIYDACQSGSFISKMRPPEGKERIIITGSSYEPAYFLENGENSFSFQFWDQTLLNEGNLGSSFSNARGIMQSYQSALIEANWDNEGNTNESEDISIADDMAIRRGSSFFIGVHPFVTSVSDPQTLLEDTSATIWASGVIDAESVWAQIIPPDINPETSDIPITDLPTIELTDPDGDHIYEGVYSSFDTEGTYAIVIKARTTHEIYSYVEGSMTTQNIYSPPMYTSVTKTDGIQNIDPDIYEEDDTYSQANVIVLNDDAPQSHNFHDVGDEDWVKFYGLSAETYKIKASSLGITCDVVIELYDSDGTTLLEGPKNDAGAGGDEFLEWLCPQDGIYYVKISNLNTNFGENTKYDLKVYIPIGPITGWIEGTIKNKCTGESIVEAMIKTNNGSSAISLPNGAYLIIHEAGTFTVTAEASGYTPVSYPDIEVSEAGTTIQDFEMTSLGDSDGDGYPDGSDAFPNDPNEWLDTDSDGIGNNADPDDDNDGMPDDWEIQYGLDPLDDSDASGDLDGDGYTNLEEYNLGRHPNNAEPEKPELSSPPDEETNVPLTPELETGIFSDPDNDDTHAETTWQISTESNFSSLVLDITSDSHRTSLTVPEFILTVDTTYYWRVKFYDNRSAASEWSDPYYSFTTIHASDSDDTDSNGIPDDQENEEVDLDGDGEPDYDQSDMKSVNTVVGDGQIGIKKESTNITSIDSIKSIDPDTISDTTNKPDEMPLGIITFKVTVDNPGDDAEVVVYLSEPAPSGAKWYKYDTIHGWREYLYATFSTDRTYVTLALKDGDWDYGDMDGTENRIIVDPSGLGATSTPSPTPPPSAGGGGGGGCFIATAAYGSPMKTHVKTLRQFRDRFMVTNCVGKVVVDIYSTYSPPVADFIANHDTVRLVVRWSLLPLVGVSWMSLNIGLTTTMVFVLLLLIMIVGASTAVVFRRMR